MSAVNIRFRPRRARRSFFSEKAERMEKKTGEEGEEKLSPADASKRNSEVALAFEIIWRGVSRNAVARDKSTGAIRASSSTAVASKPALRRDINLGRRDSRDSRAEIPTFLPLSLSLWWLKIHRGYRNVSKSLRFYDFFASASRFLYNQAYVHTCAWALFLHSRDLHATLTNVYQVRQWDTSCRGRINYRRRVDVVENDKGDNAKYAIAGMSARAVTIIPPSRPRQEHCRAWTREKSPQCSKVPGGDISSADDSAGRESHSFQCVHSCRA